MKQATTVTLTGLGAALTAGAAALLVSGCADLGYYWQSVSGHLHMMNAARPVDEWLADAQTPAQLKSRPAYSTLGLMNWAGGDPLLSTFIAYPEGELARLIFHELAHQVVYAKDDTAFNESFATAVERLGGQRWLASQASDQARKAYAEFDGRRQQFRALALDTRRELADIYKENEAPAHDHSAQAAIKLIAMQGFRERYAGLKASWGGYSGYDPWVAQANNAAFGTQAAYDELVPGFTALFQREGRDWQRFYDAVKRLAELSKDKRRQALKTDHATETPNG